MQPVRPALKDVLGFFSYETWEKTSQMITGLPNCVKLQEPREAVLPLLGF